MSMRLFFYIATKYFTITYHKNQIEKKFVWIWIRELIFMNYSRLIENSNEVSIENRKTAPVKQNSARINMMGYSSPPQILLHAMLIIRTLFFRKKNAALMRQFRPLQSLKETFYKAVHNQVINSMFVKN